MKQIATFLITLCLFTTVKSQVAIQDSLALVDFYDSTGGVNWTNHINWQTSAPVNSWFGITVTAGRVVGIDLTKNPISGNNLIGTIPASIGKLDGLLFLRLGNNKLTGAIPTTLFNLTNLKELSLNNNQLTQTIPYSFGSLTNLTKLSLAGNQLVGSIPNSISNLTKLSYLDLGFNQLTDSIPPSLGGLTNLSYLDLFGNHLTGSIPVSIGTLTNLTYLALGDNQISGSIPTSFGNLTNLLELDLGGNQLSGSIPVSLGNLTNLYRLNLGYNQLSGSIPTSIGNLTNLNFLYLNDNALSDSLPASLVNLSKLSELNIRDNQISGSIPPFFSTFSRLYNLFLNNNQLSGSVSSSLSPSLTQLNLSSNQLSGTIPTEIGNLNKLNTLVLDSNQLSGSIPDSFSSLNNLQTLGLSNNLLTGMIPSSVANILNLATLKLSSNILTGSIPTSIGNLKNLTTVRLENNGFSFAGMDNIATLANGFDSIVTSTDSFLVFKKNIRYAPQATIPLINNNNTLSVSVGGIPENNTFRWYKDSVLMATKVGDSTYSPPINGHYSVVVVNAIDTQLTLYSDTIIITALPINAISLQAKEKDGQVSLQWNTMNEINTASFIIQQSSDGINFSNIGTNNAVGSGNNSYDFTIDKSLKGTQYYRLQVIDKDGNKYCSNVAILEPLNINSRIFISPNPAKDMVIINGLHISQVNITDNLGKRVLEKRMIDATNPSLSVSGLAAGIYHIKVVTTDKMVQVLKLIVN